MCAELGFNCTLGLVEEVFWCVEVCKERRLSLSLATALPCGLKPLGKVQFLPWVEEVTWFIKDFPGNMVSVGAWVGSLR